MNLLYISPIIPYDSIGHAGGQTFNYYIKHMALHSNASISIVSFFSEKEMTYNDIDLYGIKCYRIKKDRGLLGILKRSSSIVSKLNPFDKYGNMMSFYSAKLLLNKLHELKNNKYNPDIIILEWTQVTLMIHQIRDIFPDAKFISSEHDVSYLGAFRKAYYTKNIFRYKYKLLQANNLKRREVDALKQCDIVYTHNQKDNDLLKTDGIIGEKRRVLIPYFHKSNLDRNRKNNNIIFFGNMKREENYLSAIWFINNVMPLLKDYPISFYIIGGNPPEKLKEMATDNIKITGFVDNIDIYFAEAMCFVAPLVLGAGIKVKVLEALYSGIPVLTNAIGIEGIPAIPNVDYYDCDAPQEYAKTIIDIYYNKINFENLPAREFVKNEFSYEKSFYDYRDTILNLYSKK